MTDQARLIIHTLEIENFKSYGGKKTIGPFHESFTSIVGPNGSGKSNVIDAILFVFGYRSTKIRSKKLSFLIHTSEKFPNIECATVSVNFRKIKDGELDPDFLLTVSRTARRDNSSDYYINGAKSSYKVVTQTLRSLDIDLDHNRFLILQGEVEQISLMKPKASGDGEEGLLEFLEDIIGTNKYKDNIRELTTSVDDMDEQMVEKINRFKVVDLEKKRLESPKNDVINYIDQENRLNTLICLDLHLKLQELTEKDCNVLAIQKQLVEDKQNIESHLAEIDAQKAKRTAELHALEKTCLPLIKTIEKQNKLVSSLERNQTKLTQDLIHVRENKKKAEEDREREKKNYETAKSQPTKSSANFEKLNKGKELIENEINDIEKTIENLLPDVQKKTAHLQTEKEQKEKLLLEKAKILADMDVKVNAAKNSINLLVSKRDQLTAEIQTNKKSIASIQKELVSKKEIYEKSSKELPSMKKILDSDTNELNQLYIKEKSITSELAEKNAILEQHQSNESLQKIRSKIIRELLKQRNSGNIPGILGRLGDLGTIDPKYDCAISSCCSMLDHCLVDNMDTAIRCVEFLRKNNLGIASFLALDKMESHRSQSQARFNAPNNSKRLFDLVTPDDASYAPAFYFALRDTLVTDTIDGATKIAFSGKTRFRVATLMGEIVEKNGTITCGGEPIRGRITLTGERRTSAGLPKINPDVLAREIGELTQQKSEVLSQISETEKRISETKSEIEKMNANVEKIPKETKILEQEMTNMTTQNEKLTKEYETSLPDQNELNKAQMDLELEKKEREKAKSNYDIVEEQIKKINSQIEVIRGGLLDTHNTELSSKRRLLDDIIAELNKVTAAASANQRMIQKSESSLKDLEKNLEKLENQLSKLETEYESVSKELICQRESLTKIEEENSDSCAKLKTIKADLTTFERENASDREKLLDIKIKSDEIVAQVRSHDSKVEHIHTQMEKLIIRSFTDDGQEVTSAVPTPEPSEITQINRHKIQEQIKGVKSFLESQTPNFNIIEQYCRIDKLHLERSNELQEFTNIRDAKYEELRSLKTKRLNEFMDGFATINYKLKEMYQLITFGGDAELELVDSLNPFIEGVVFSVRPPHKSWKYISNLSGGEKTISSLALVFALHHYKPTPFYVMDEIDAALDFRNVSIVANYIKQRTQNVQFIIISLRDNMFELANRLVGIYKTENCTKSVVLYLDKVGVVNSQ